MVQPKCWRHLGDADIHANNDQALYWASYNGHLAVVKYLIEHGADIHVHNDYALHNGHKDVVEYLNNHINNEKKELKSKKIEELQKQLIDIQNQINDLMKM